MLYGFYQHTIDKKNRVQMPAKLREQMSETMVVFKHIEEECLAVYSEEEWEKIRQKIDDLPSVENAWFARRVYAYMTLVQPDAQGRILLPQTLVDYAGLEKNVTVIGVGNHAEIWDSSKYEKASFKENLPDIVERLKQSGF
ncbi:MAG: division/cell wall cluster transcriptional repressor MraZ [Clostridia bacterium]|nr:division/cell wall cluster transcriptional repressor MraZ [Clostridia bacterium]